MAYIKPNSTLQLLYDVPITGGEEIAFANVAEQNAYFARHVKVSGTKYSRLDPTNNTIKVPYAADLCRSCNMLRFKNTAYEDKWFYAFIVNVSYVNNTTSRITYVMNEFQTWFANVDYDTCTVLREHLSIEDWNKAETNPFDTSILEFQTAEDLATGYEIEPVYEQGELDNKSRIGHNGDWDVFPTNTASGIILQLASIDEANAANFVADYCSNFTMVLRPDNTYVESGFLPKPSPNVKNMYPHAYYLCFIDTDDTTLGNGNKMTNAQVMGKLNTALQWLTLNNLTQNILGIYYVDSSQFYESVWDRTGEYSIAKVYPRTFDVTNKKLNLFPFQYIRVDNGNGDTKEYKYELFKDIREGGAANPAKFKYLSMFDGVPMVSLLPYKYRQTNDNVEPTDTYGFNYNLNAKERLDNKNIPQLGYSIDAYLAYLGSAYQSALTTSAYSYMMNAQMPYVNAATSMARLGMSSTFDGIASLPQAPQKMTTAMQVYNPVLTLDPPAQPTNHRFNVHMPTDMNTNNTGLAQPIASHATAILNAQNTQKAAEEAASVRGGQVSLTAANLQSIASGEIQPSSGDIQTVNQAYSADYYRAGSTNGTLSFYVGTTAVAQFNITRVRLLDTVLEKYDKYFSLYGYKSGRIGIPRICNYTLGVTGDSINPHFDMSLKYPATYVQTMNLHCIFSMTDVCSYIENLFNGGCRFLKGSELP